MPKYDYICPSCNKTEEIQRKMSDYIRPLCSFCFAKGLHSELKQGFSAGLGVHFKGSGFYETDYK